MKKPGWRTLSASLSVMIAFSVTYVFSTHALAQKSNSPFAGRWDFDIQSARGIGARWLGVTETDANRTLDQHRTNPICPISSGTI